MIFRRHLLDYLTGKSDELQGNDASVPVATHISFSELTEKLDRERNEPRTKRPRLDET